MRPDSAETHALLGRIAAGDAGALGELLGRHRARLGSFVDVHLDGPLRARFDPSDVVQETQMEVVRRMDDYLARRPMPFRLWLCKTAKERLIDLRRVQTRRKRSVRREVGLPDRSSLLLARPLLDAGPSPSQHAEAREMEERVSRAVAGLSEQEREVLLMRQAEQMPFDEVACLLGVTPEAARQRFGRALIRLREALRGEGLLG